MSRREEVFAWRDDDGVEMAIVSDTEHGVYLAQLMHGEWAPMGDGTEHWLFDISRRRVTVPKVSCASAQPTAADLAVADEIERFIGDLMARPRWGWRRLVRPAGFLIWWPGDYPGTVRVIQAGEWPTSNLWSGGFDRCDSLHHFIQRARALKLIRPGHFQGWRPEQPWQTSWIAQQRPRFKRGQRRW